MSKVIVVGCGHMGSNLVRAFMEKGHQVSIVDLNPAAAQPFVEKGAAYYERLDLAGESDLVVLNLLNINIVRTVLNGLRDGWLEGRTVLNTTTSIPADALEMAGMITERGGIALDAKILCYPPEVGTESSFMVFCGPKAPYDAAEPIIKAICAAPWYLGEGLANGAVLDNAGTEVQCAVRYAMCEAVKLALNNNAELEPLFTILTDGIPGVIEANIRQIRKNFADGNSSANFGPAEEGSVNMIHSCLKTLQSSFTRSGIDSPFNRAMIDTYQRAVDSGLGENEDCTIIKVI